MSYRLFLDDTRNVPMVYPSWKNDDFTIARTYEAFVRTIQTEGLPIFISFDNELYYASRDIDAKTGYDCALWLVNESGLDLKDLKFFVHSSSPIARKKIKELLENHIKLLRKDNTI